MTTVSPFDYSLELIITAVFTGVVAGMSWTFGQLFAHWLHSLYRKSKKLIEKDLIYNGKPKEAEK